MRFYYNSCLLCFFMLVLLNRFPLIISGMDFY
jgi:hypothetical protein